MGDPQPQNVSLYSSIFDTVLAAGNKGAHHFEIVVIDGQFGLVGPGLGQSGENQRPLLEGVRREGPVVLHQVLEGTPDLAILCQAPSDRRGQASDDLSTLARKLVDVGSLSLAPCEEQEQATHWCLFLRPHARCRLLPLRDAAIVLPDVRFFRCVYDNLFLETHSAELWPGTPGFVPDGTARLIARERDDLFRVPLAQARPIVHMSDLALARGANVRRLTPLRPRPQEKVRITLALGSVGQGDTTDMGRLLARLRQERVRLDKRIELLEAVFPSGRPPIHAQFYHHTDAKFQALLRRASDRDLGTLLHTMFQAGDGAYHVVIPSAILEDKPPALFYDPNTVTRPLPSDRGGVLVRDEMWRHGSVGIQLFVPPGQPLRPRFDVQTREDIGKLVALFRNPDSKIDDPQEFLFAIWGEENGKLQGGAIALKDFRPLNEDFERINEGVVVQLHKLPFLAAGQTDRSPVGTQAAAQAYAQLYLDQVRPVLDQARQLLQQELRDLSAQAGRASARIRKLVAALDGIEAQLKEDERRLDQLSEDEQALRQAIDEARKELSKLRDAMEKEVVGDLHRIADIVAAQSRILSGLVSDHQDQVGCRRALRSTIEQYHKSLCEAGRIYPRFDLPRK